MRYLGIDYGTKKIGVALSDEKGKMAFPYSVVVNSGREKTAEKIKEKFAKKIMWGKLFWGGR